MQGAVSSSSRLERLKLNTITKNGNSFKTAFGSEGANAGKYHGTSTAPYFLKSKYQPCVPHHRNGDHTNCFMTPTGSVGQGGVRGIRTPGPPPPPPTAQQAAAQQAAQAAAQQAAQAAAQQAAQAAAQQAAQAAAQQAAQAAAQQAAQAAAQAAAEAQAQAAAAEHEEDYHGY